MTTGDNKIHEAIRWEDDIRPLIRRGFDINHLNDHHMTPLYVAVYQGNRDAVQALLAAGANYTIAGPEHRFPLDEAIHQARIDIALDLIAAGAPMLGTSLVDAVRLYDPRPALALIARGADPNIQQIGTSNRPIHFAAQGAPITIMQALIDAGAQLNHRDARQHTALLNAAYDGLEEHTALLLRWGAEPSIADQQGRTPLAVAVMRNHPKVVGAILATELGRATIDQPNRAGITPLQIARLDGRSDLVDLLIGAEQEQER